MSRWSLAVLYLLATLVALRVHDHGPCPEFETDDPHHASAESGLLLNSHASSDETSPSHDCAACQFQAEHQAEGLPAPLTLAIPRTAASGNPFAPRIRGSSITRATGRAPPRV
jgi:hypothetical protein